MIGASMPPIAGDTAADALRLLSSIADPKATAERINHLRAVEAQAQAAIDRLAEAQKEHDKREAELVALRDVEETKARIAAKAITDAAKADAARIRAEVERLHTAALGDYQTVAEARAAADAAKAEYQAKLATLRAAIEAVR